MKRKQIILVFACITLCCLPALSFAQSTTVSGTSNWLNDFATKISDNFVNTTNKDVLNSVLNWARGIMVIAWLFIAFTEIYLLFKGEKKGSERFLWPKLFVVMALIIFIPQVSGFAFDIFTAFNDQVGKVITTKDNSTNLDVMIAEYQKKIGEAIDKNYEKSSGLIGPSLERSGNRIASTLYIFTLQGFLMLYNLVCFFVTVFSTCIVRFLLIFFPVVLALNFLPGFSQGLTQYVKYLISISLWVLLATVMRGIVQTIGFNELLGQLYAAQALAANGNLGSSDLFSLSSIVALVVMVFMIGMIPMFADILISGSQSGAFFSASVGKATEMSAKGINSVSKAGKDSLKSVTSPLSSIIDKVAGDAGYKTGQSQMNNVMPSANAMNVMNSGAQGSAQTSTLKSFEESSKGVMEGIKKMYDAPKKES